MKQFPALRCIVQTNDEEAHRSWRRHEGDASSPVAMTKRTMGAPQTVLDAAVYILHLPASAPSEVLCELMAHFAVLQACGASMLIWTGYMLPEPGSIPNSDSETLARSLDLAQLRLTGKGEMEIVDLLRLIESIGNGTRKLAVAKTIRSRDDIVVALLVTVLPTL